MAEYTTYTISLAQFRQLFSDAGCINVKDGFCVIDLRYEKSLSILKHPCRIDGFLFFFCISGKITIRKNLTDFEVTEDSLFVNFPGDVITVPGDIGESQKAELHFIVMAMTREYMSGLKMDMPQLLDKGMALLKNPCFTLTGEERAVAKKYLDLASDISSSGLLCKKECLASMMSSLFYLAGGVLERRLCDLKVSGGSRRLAGRGKAVFDRFMELVSEYHMRERSVGFYADKLCITPKYLSKLVKSVSGRSAPEWIDDYVMLEAKNMLKYSRLPIKEIVSRLNFSNPSTFHKFFKAKAGVTPLKYRKMK